MKNLQKYIIVEIIPTTSKKETGEIIQIQALKLNNLKLIDRFDYRLSEDQILNQDLKKMISYDKSNFTYLTSSQELFQKFQEFIGNLPLLILENDYTIDYLKDLKNPKYSILKYLNLDLTDDVFAKIITKYHLTFSNHFVDLLYEALIYENNQK